MRDESRTEALVIDGVIYILQPDGSLRPARDRTDRSRIRAMSASDMERMARDDVDKPASDAGHWSDAVVGLPPLKTDVHARFDAEVVDWFKAQGRGYQTRMNSVLRRYMESHAGAGKPGASKPASVRSSGRPRKRAGRGRP